MAVRSRHAKPRSRASKAGALAAAMVTLAGVAVASLLILRGSADASPSHPVAASGAVSKVSNETALADNLVTTEVHRASATMAARAIAKRAKAAARRKHQAALAAHERAARRRARKPAPPPSPPASPSPPPTGDPAQSALGVCIRDAEEGGSYVWGPGNGGGAYQFLLSTWERYGGAAGEYGVASAGYQDQIFDNAIAAGGASNWTAYDGC